MAATFTGSSYLSVASVPASQTLKSSPVSFAIWVRPTSAGGTVIDTGTLGYYIGIVSANVDPGPPVNFKDTIAVFNDSGAGTWFLDLEQNEFVEELVTQGDATTLNAWVHYAATYDGSNHTTGGMVLYKNGAVIANGITGGAVTSTIAWDRVVVGGFNGDAQDAFVYNRVLTQAEVLDLYRGRTQRISTANIVGHWPLYADNRGLDISGQGRNLSATGTVVAGTNNAPTSTWYPGSTRALRTLAVSTGQLSSGNTQTTGTSAVQISVGSSGNTQSSGSSAVQIQAPSTGTTQSTGASAFQGQVPSSGLTQTTGLTLVSSVSSAGTTQTTGASAVGISAGSTGNTQSTGASAVQVSATSAGLTQSSGSSALQGQFTSIGTTQSTGASTATGTNAPIGGGDGQQVGSERRWSPVGGMRRIVRR